MKGILEKTGRFVGRAFVYYSGATNYVGVFNFIMITATFIATYKFNIPLYVAIPLSLAGLTVVGVFHYKFVQQHQSKHINMKNSIYIRLRKLEKDTSMIPEIKEMLQKINNVQGGPRP